MKKIKKLTMFLAALMACGTMSVASGCMDLVMTGLMPQSSSETTDGSDAGTSSEEGESSVEEGSSEEEGSSDGDDSSVEEATKFVVTFKNADGTVLQSAEVEEGEMPVYAGTTPTKAADAQYSYTFKGWDKELTAVTAETVYTATYTQTVNSYTITFKNADGTILQSSELNYGETPSYEGTPEKAGDVQHSYTFNGWDKSIAAVTGDATYIATYTQSVKKYTITFKNDNGDVLQSTEVAYGETPEYKGEAPTKAATEQYTYTFAGFGNIAAVVGNATYTATYEKTVQKYTVVFKNADDTVLQSADVEYGDLPVFVGTTPTKEGDAEFSYTFKGWDKAITAVTGAVEYKATYNEIRNKYVVTFKNADGSVLQSSEVEYGETPAYDGEPTKAADMQYVYTFAGWTPEIKVVDGTATYVATYTETPNTYKVTLKYNNDVDADETINGATYAMSASALYANAPEKEGHTFEGWYINGTRLEESALITGEVVIEAKYTINTYTVQFVNWNDEVLQEVEVEWNKLPVYTKDTPTRENTTDTEYAFSGWSPEIVVATENAVYKAQFAEGYSVQWMVDDNVYETTKVVKGEAATAPADPTMGGDAQYSYNFLHWSTEKGGAEATFEPINASGMKYYAVFEQVVNEYTVTFVDDNGDVLSQETLAYGAAITAPADPTKEDTAEYDYTFAGWDSEVAATVTGDVTYTATYTAVKQKYTITFANNVDGTVVEQELEYGETPAYEAVATKTTTEDHSTTKHEFKGWDKAFETVTGEATYTAQYAATVSTWDGTLPESATEADFLHGAGTESDPYVLATATDLAYMTVFTAGAAKDTIFYADKYFVLSADMDLSAADWTPICNGTNYNWTYFGGNLDGQEHTVTYNTNSEESADFYGFGLFEGVQGGTIQNINFAGTIKVKHRVGALAYFGKDVTLKNITSDVDISGLSYASTKDLNSYAGGILGTISTGATIENCHNTGDISIDDAIGTGRSIGGIVGNISAATTITDCTNEGAITGEQKVGGLVGNITGSIAVAMTNCSNEGEVSGDQLVGGIVGYITSAAQVSIVDGANQGTITATTSYAGGLVGCVTAANTKLTITTDKKENNTNSAPIKASTQYAGGIVGSVATSASADIQYCQNTGTITAGKYAGGIIGFVYKGVEGALTIVEVANCVNGEQGTVSASEGAGGIIGSRNYNLNDLTITYCTNNGTVSATTKQVGGIIAYLYHSTAHPGAVNNCTNTGTVKLGDVEATSEIGAEFVPGLIVGQAAGSAASRITNNKFYCTVTWVNYDGTVLETDTVMANSDITPEYNGETPTKDADAQGTYTFAGWGTVSEVTGSVTYTATFTCTHNKYTVTFVDEDGTTVLDTQEVEHGKTPTAPADPTKASTTQYDYTFAGWTPAIDKVTGNATYTATYTETVRKYTIKFVNYDGTELQSGEVAYGETPEYTGATPIKAGDAEHNYSFTGWTPEISDVTGEATYTATFEEAKNEYTVTFYDENGDELQSGLLEYGATPTAPTATKDGYVFAGWATTQNGTVLETLPTVTAAAEYYAVFTYSIWDGSFPSVEGKKAADFFEEAGTAEDPYLIESAADLAALSALSWTQTYGADMYFKQTVNIDLSGGNWVPICDRFNNVDGGWVNANARTTMFNGTFDGGNYAVKMKEATAEKTFFVGLFFAIGNGGTVKNLKLEGTLDMAIYSGVLSAMVIGSATIDNVDSWVTFNTTSDSGPNSIVGLIGLIQLPYEGTETGVTIQNCDNHGTITATGQKVGAIVGQIFDKAEVTIKSCTNDAAISSGASNIGGLVGRVNSNAVVTIEDCTNSGEVTGSDLVGGILGQNYVGTVTITGTTNTGEVNATHNVGGIVGYVCSLTDENKVYHLASITVSDCTNTGAVTASGSNAAGIVGGRTWHGSTIIDTCTNSGAISAGSGQAGGIACYMHHNGQLGVNGKVLNCTNKGTVTLNGVSATSGYGTETNKIGYILGYPETDWLELSGNTYMVDEQEYVTIIWKRTDGGNLLVETKAVGAELAFSGTEPTKDGLVFLGWTDVKGGSDVVELTTVTESLVLYPVFGAIERTLFAGSGTAEDPYQIATADDLWELSNLTKGKSYGSADLYFKLTANIDVSDKTWQPICASADAGWVETANSFNANFDGNDKTITYKGEYTGDTWAKGLFSAVGGHVHNLILRGSITIETGRVGSLASMAMENANIEKVISYVNITAGNNQVGGIIGYVTAEGVKITDCENHGAIQGSELVGGIVGGTYQVITYTNCVNYGNITATSMKAGGIAGEAPNNTHFKTCTNDANAVITSGTTEATTYFAVESAGFYVGQAPELYLPTVWNVDGVTNESWTLVNKAPSRGIIPIKDGYVFMGWSATEGGAVIDVPVVTSYTTYYAVFEELTVTGEAYFEGEGTAENPYLIKTAVDLWYLSTLAKGKTYGEGMYFKLTADIDVSSAWTPICDTDSSDGNNWPSNAFMGTFDGSDFTITLISQRATHTNGLFAAIGGTVKNLTIAGTVGGNTALTFQGALASVAKNGAVIENVHNTANVKGSSNVGGLVGGVENGSQLTTFTNCTNTGTITGSGNFVGGLVGGGWGATTFDNCHNSGNITSSDVKVGAIAGEFFGSTNLASGGGMTNCSNTIGETTGVIKVGEVDQNGKLAGNA